MLKPQQMLRSEIHNVFTEKNNKIALTASDDKKTPDAVISYQFSTGTGILCKTELIRHPKIKT